MEKTKEKVIDGITFTVAPFPAIEALRLKSYLMKTLGPALARPVDVSRAQEMPIRHFRGIAFWRGLKS